MLKQKKSVTLDFATIMTKLCNICTIFSWTLSKNLSLFYPLNNITRTLFYTILHIVFIHIVCFCILKFESIKYWSIVGEIKIELDFLPFIISWKLFLEIFFIFFFLVMNYTFQIRFINFGKTARCLNTNRMHSKCIYREIVSTKNHPFVTCTHIYFLYSIMYARTP